MAKAKKNETGYAAASGTPPTLVRMNERGKLVKPTLGGLNKCVATLAACVRDLQDADAQIKNDARATYAIVQSHDEKYDGIIKKLAQHNGHLVNDSARIDTLDRWVTEFSKSLAELAANIRELDKRLTERCDANTARVAEVVEKSETMHGAYMCENETLRSNINAPEERIAALESRKPWWRIW